MFTTIQQYMWKYVNSTRHKKLEKYKYSILRLHIKTTINEVVNLKISFVPKFCCKLLLYNVVLSAKW